MGGTFGTPYGSGNLVQSGPSGSQHQPARVEGGGVGIGGLQRPDQGLTRHGPDGQCRDSGPLESSRGHEVPQTDDRGLEPTFQGRTPSGFHTGGTHCGEVQCYSGLAQQNRSGPHRMETGPLYLPGTDGQIRNAYSGLIRIELQRPTTQILLQVSDTGSGGHRRVASPVAEGLTVRLSSALPNSSGDSKDSDRAGGCHLGGPTLATTSLVRRPGEPLDSTTVEDPGRGCLPQPGVSATPGTRVVALDRLAIEGDRLRRLSLPEQAIPTFQAARRASTKRIYQSTWAAYCAFCATQNFEPLRFSLYQIIAFLQAGLDKGLAPNTLRRHVAALSTVLREDPRFPLSQDPCIKEFLRGAANIKPPPVHRFPTWDLPLVLNALTTTPFEPLRTIPLPFLSYKVAFLVAITSARRVSELAALSVRPDLCTLYPDRVVLRLDPTFMPKVNTAYHRSLELVLPDFYVRGSSAEELRWHKLDVRRAIKIYTRRTLPFRKTEAMFVSFRHSSEGLRVSSQTISRWIRKCIAEAYKASSVPLPAGVTAHSTRSAASSAAWATQTLIEDICRAASWATPVTFIKHYRIDTFASAEAAFGRRVLQRVCSLQAPLVQPSPSHVT